MSIFSKGNDAIAGDVNKSDLVADGDWPQQEDSVVLAVHLGAALEVRQLEGDLLALVRHHLLYHNHPESD